MANCRQFNAGQVFSLTGHPDANGKYLMTSVQHDCRVSGDPRSATQDSVEYHNEFQCIPLALTYRPPRSRPCRSSTGARPRSWSGRPGGDLHRQVRADQSAVPLGPRGRNNEHSSCWIRVGGPTRTGARVRPRCPGRVRRWSWTSSRATRPADRRRERLQHAAAATPGRGGSDMEERTRRNALQRGLVCWAAWSGWAPAAARGPGAASSGRGAGRRSMTLQSRPPPGRVGSRPEREAGDGARRPVRPGGRRVGELHVPPCR
jgi:hypothetical protein